MMILSTNKQHNDQLIYDQVHPHDAPTYPLTTNLLYLQLPLLSTEVSLPRVLADTAA